MSKKTRLAPVTPLTTRQGVIQTTGEVVDVEFPAVRRPRRFIPRKAFALVDLDNLARLELSAVQWRVFTVLMRAVNAETNEARMQIRELAGQLGMPATNVSRVLGTLRDRGLIRTRRTGHHEINRHLMFRGSAADWDTATVHEPEPTWRRP